MHRVNYARRQEYRRFRRAAAPASVSAAVALLALVIASAGAMSLAAWLLVLALVTETKTRTYEQRHLARVGRQAAWLLRRRRWCRNGAVAVLCLVRARGVRRVDRDVLVVSIDQLIPALRSAIVVLPVWLTKRHPRSRAGELRTSVVSSTRRVTMSGAAG